MTKGGMHGEGGMHDKRDMCCKDGCALQSGCMHGKGGACMVKGGHAWLWGEGAWLERWPLQQAVCTLLECILVYGVVLFVFH